MTPMTRDEHQATLDRMDQSSIDVAMQTKTTIADHVERLAAEHPDKIFVIYEGQSISYGQVNYRANDFARIALQQGIGPGDTVGLMMENRPEFFYAWFGMLKIGAVTALINTHAKTRAEEIER